MAQELAIIDPIRLPDAARPSLMPCPPPWLQSAIECMQDDPDGERMPGSHRLMPRIPTASMPSPAQREAVTAHVKSLRSFLEQTAVKSAEHGDVLLELVEELLRAKPSQRAVEMTHAARLTSYIVALDDVPTWAVRESIRRWYRGDCHTYGQVRPDYTWAPDTDQLRRLSIAEMWKVGERVRVCQNLLDAQPMRPPATDEDRARVQAIFEKMARRMATRSAARERLARIRRANAATRFREQRDRVIAELQASEASA